MFAKRYEIFSIGMSIVMDASVRMLVYLSSDTLALFLHRLL